MIFSDISGGTGIVQQVRNLMRVDAVQYPTIRIVNSVNNWLDTVTGYAIGADRRFEFDDTNHSKLPIGTTAINANQVDYSFLTDEQGNAILNLTSVSLIEIATDKEIKLTPVDRGDDTYYYESFGIETGVPTEYDKIADNIIKLNVIPTADEAAKYELKFYFQRTPSYFTESDTTKAPGVPPLLHRGFVIAAAYDGAITLGLENTQMLSVELQKEEIKMQRHFSNRNTDEVPVMMPPQINSV